MSINCCLFDLDNCLICSLSPYEMRGSERKGIDLDLVDNGRYDLFVHPKAKELIDYARCLVGIDNVYILTTATKQYALEVNRLAEFGFTKKNIKAREDFYFPVRLGYGEQYPTFEKWSKNNVLIDDLPYDWQDRKTSYIGNIPTENYLEIIPYNGVDLPGDEFEKKVMSFLEERMKADVESK
jgi:hypothetical protein